MNRPAGARVRVRPPRHAARRSEPPSAVHPQCPKYVDPECRTGPNCAPPEATPVSPGAGLRPVASGKKDWSQARQHSSRRCRRHQWPARTLRRLKRLEVKIERRLRDSAAESLRSTAAAGINFRIWAKSAGEKSLSFDEFSFFVSSSATCVFKEALPDCT